MGRFELERPTKSTARCRKENARKKSPDGTSLSGWRAERRPRVFEREHGHTKNKWLRHLARHPPRFAGGEKRDGRQACPGPRQRIRVISLGCLTSKSLRQIPLIPRTWGASCPALCRASTSCRREDVDGRDKPGHDG